MDNTILIRKIERHIRWILGYNTDAEKNPQYESMSMLYMIAEYGQLSQYAKQLVACGEDPNRSYDAINCPSVKQYPLVCAISNNSGIETIRALLECRADPNLRDDWGTALIHALYASNSNELLELLLHHGAKTDLPIISKGKRDITKVLGGYNRPYYGDTSRRISAFNIIFRHEYKIQFKLYMSQYVSFLLCIRRADKDYYSSLKTFVTSHIYDRNVLRIICSFLKPKLEHV